MIPWVAPTGDLPDVSLALSQPNGLLAMGGALSAEFMLKAYKKGVFPWYAEGEPVLWWSPDPRCVLFPPAFCLHRSLAKKLKQTKYKITCDRAFERVLWACASVKGRQGHTWITQDMLSAYRRLHTLGYAHSIDVWLNDDLVGGLFGVVVGHVFFAESMFSSERDTSKMALAYLCSSAQSMGIELIDCQLPTSHLLSLGACTLSRRDFVAYLERWAVQDTVTDWLGCAG